MDFQTQIHAECVPDTAGLVGHHIMEGDKSGRFHISNTTTAGA